MEKKEYTLVGVNGNAYSIMGYVARAMKCEGYTREEIAKYKEEAMSGDYDHLLAVSANMIDDLNKIIEL